MNKSNINEILKTWGEKKRALPANNEALKQEILLKAPVSFGNMPVKNSYPWLSIALTSFAVLVFVINSVNPNFKSDNNSVSMPVVPAGMPESVGMDYAQSGAPVNSSMVAPDFYYKNYGNPPVTDTREFLKKYYNATIKTRQVDEMASKVELAVRGSGGRIDSLNTGEEYGYVGFAVPATKFEMFREEIRSLTGRKLIVENMSSENLLPQKQSIEERQGQIEKSITELKNEKDQLTKNHNQTLASYNGKIKSINSQMAALQAEYPNASPERKAQINALLYDLQAEKEGLQSKISSENRNYQNQLANLNQGIKSLEESLNYVNKEDKNLMDDVETVSGTISLDKVNVWEIMEIYVPGPLLGWILLVLAALAYLRYRRNYFRTNQIVF